MTLRCRQLIQSIGTRLTNHKNQQIGTLADVRIDLRKNDPSYIILSSSGLAGGKDLYFAISDHPSLVEITPEGKIVIRVEKETLYNATSIRADEIPEKDSKTKAVFRLSDYSKTAYQPFK